VEPGAHFGVTLLKEGAAHGRVYLISPRCRRTFLAALACLSKTVCFRDFGGATGSISLIRSMNRFNASTLVQFVPPTLMTSKWTILPLLLLRPWLAQRNSVEGCGGFFPLTLGSRRAASASERQSSSNRLLDKFSASASSILRSGHLAGASTTLSIRPLYCSVEPIKHPSSINGSGHRITPIRSWFPMIEDGWASPEHPAARYGPRLYTRALIFTPPASGGSQIVSSHDHYTNLKSGQSSSICRVGAEL